MTSASRRRTVPALCLAVLAVVWVALAIAPVYREDWLLENLLTFAVVPAWIWADRRRHFSNRAWLQATLFLVLHTIGSHYTYSEVPAGFWARDAFGLARNHYDRLVHFAFGLLMLRPLRELTLRDAVGVGRLSAAYLCVASVALWSVLYELLEWVVALLADPLAGTAYLGTQGDEWDAQKDMALAVLGALLAVGGEDWSARRRRGRP